MNTFPRIESEDTTTNAVAAVWAQGKVSWVDVAKEEIEQAIRDGSDQDIDPTFIAIY